MARTRKTSKEALEEKIEKAEADVIAAKKKYDQATANLKELLDKRDAIRKEEILSAVVKSGRSYEERFFFLPHTIAKRNGKIRYFSGYFCDILIRGRIRPERKYYVTKIICFFQERNRFVNCSDPGASFYVLGQTG